IKSVISDHYYFSTPARIGDIENDQIAMYPNPSNGVFTLELNNFEGNNFEVNITNALGQIVYTTMIDVTENNYTQTIDLGNAAAGIYQVTLKNASTTMNYAISIND
ncbi:MAG TPA: T9SS type A sorting domain-containing protein, partial [Chitinophagales bacterium]|nr:T9SS type A sorting domain-containing protein [Chitinophagales bacterium]